MKLELKITGEKGKETTHTLHKSATGKPKTLNDFIIEALSISEDKRDLPFLIQCPNGLEVYPSIKMKFENYGSPMLGDKLEAMLVTYQD